MSEYQFSIEELIKTIIDISNEELFYNEPVDAQYIFQNGECYELALVLKHFITNSFLVIDKDYEHCAIQFHGRIYDSRGDVTSIFQGHIANEQDMDYMEDRFGIPEKGYINGQRLSEWLINYIDGVESITNNLPFYIQSKGIDSNKMK